MSFCESAPLTPQPQAQAGRQVKKVMESFVPLSSAAVSIYSAKQARTENELYKFSLASEKS